VVAGAGDVEWISDFGNVDFGAAFDTYYFGTTPWEDPQRYIELAHKAWNDGEISKRRAAEVLGISHFELEDRMEEEAASLESPEAYHGVQ
jgi:hypothetical protein